MLFYKFGKIFATITLNILSSNFFSSWDSYYVYVATLVTLTDHCFLLKYILCLCRDSILFFTLHKLNRPEGPFPAFHITYSCVGAWELDSGTNEPELCQIVLHLPNCIGCLWHKVGEDLAWRRFLFTLFNSSCSSSTWFTDWKRHTHTHTYNLFTWWHLCPHGFN